MTGKSCFQYGSPRCQSTSCTGKNLSDRYAIASPLLLSYSKNLFTSLRMSLLFFSSPKTQNILFQDHFSHYNWLQFSPFPSLHLRSIFRLMQKFNWRLRATPKLNFDPPVSCWKPCNSVSQSTWGCTILFKDSSHLKLRQVSVHIVAE